ncbi:unannotated protein [freshwater metagenome]|jgi:2-phospho-L-lactate guanylyltransferase|uniref:Unannotated protein n=1 Tax=freshwater metagenome TaxID=449393 RepID=A0A6J7DBL4_9ZZZZ|nr:2-phospho-L-lactate guanylyltransferase [Actinomycetota bacterium]
MSAWCLLVPVKRLDRAKTRLHLPGLTQEMRSELALAFASDVVLAAVQCSVVKEIVVITDDSTAAEQLESLGAHTVSDSPDAGINPALEHGFQWAQQHWPELRVAALSADVACVRASDLTLALNQAASTSDAQFVCDSAGTGTTMYVGGSEFSPSFGHRSRARHVRAGAIELTSPELGRLRRDIDTEADLWDARRLGLGPNSTGVLAQL